MLTHTQRWGRQNEVKRRGNKSRGVPLLISSWVHHFKQAETAGEGSAAEQRPSQLGWLMHSGEALHTPTLSLTLGDSLSCQNWTLPRQLRMGWWEVYVWRGVGWRKKTCDGRCCLFFTFILSRGCLLWSNTRVDRRHPLPLGPLNWAPTSQPGPDVSVSRITTNYEPSHSCLPLLCTPNIPGAAVDRALLSLSCVPFPSNSTFSDSSSTAGNTNSRVGRGKGGGTRKLNWMWQTEQYLWLLKKIKV